MRPHNKPTNQKGLFSNIALSCFFVALALIGFYLSWWQYSKGLIKESLISDRQHLLSFEIIDPTFTFSIEQGNREKHFYVLGKSASSMVMIDKNLANSGVLKGYWHPIEKNIFQSQKIIQLDSVVCSSYSLWACAHATDYEIYGVIREKAWEPSMAPKRHYAYAAQWAGLGAVAFFMSIISLRLLVLRLTNVFSDTCCTA